MSLPVPQFIPINAQQIIADMVADYESRTGKTLQPAQVEQLVINAMAYREVLLRGQVQEAALQNLLAFASYPMIDYLGELLGVVRLPASAAEVTILLSFVSGHGPLTVPSGIRIASSDGQAVFETTAVINVDEDIDSAEVDARCQQVGKLGNGYAVDTIFQILDPQAYLASATNTVVSGGGADQETDDELRERIKLAPSAFSTAGSYGAYKFHAKSAHPSIVDVAVLGPGDDEGINPGEVYIYPLVEGGIVTPDSVLDAVQAVCGADKVRPITDSVIVNSPTKVDYSIEVALELYDGSDEATTITTVENNLAAFVAKKKNLLGQDVVLKQLEKQCMLDGIVYNLDVASPSSDVVIDAAHFSNCTNILVTVSGFSHG